MLSTTLYAYVQHVYEQCNMTPPGPAGESKPEQADSASSSPLSSSTSPDASRAVDACNNEDANSPNASSSRLTRFRRAYDAASFTPKRCRWDAVEPPKFNIWLNLLFGAAGAFTVANLYYTHPILDILAQDFGVDYVAVAEIPTLAQAGYALGLLTLCPLGDLLRRRPFVLYLVFFTASLS